MSKRKRRARAGGLPAVVMQRIASLEKQVHNLTAWADGHAEWHKNGEIELSDEDAQLMFPEMAGNEEGGDLPAVQMGGQAGSAPGAEKEGL